MMDYILGSYAGDNYLAPPNNKSWYHKTFNKPRRKKK